MSLCSKAKFLTVLIRFSSSFKIRLVAFLICSARAVSITSELVKPKCIKREFSPTYSATLVKYAELICDRPGAQGKISNIKVD